jgi:hypothetical protein
VCNFDAEKTRIIVARAIKGNLKILVSEGLDEKIWSRFVRAIKK